MNFTTTGREVISSIPGSHYVTLSLTQDEYEKLLHFCGRDRKRLQDARSKLHLLGQDNGNYLICCDDSIYEEFKIYDKENRSLQAIRAQAERDGFDLDAYFLWEIPLCDPDKWIFCFVKSTLTVNITAMKSLCALSTMKRQEMHNFLPLVRRQSFGTSQCLIHSVQQMIQDSILDHWSRMNFATTGREVAEASQGNLGPMVPHTTQNRKDVFYNGKGKFNKG